MCSRCSDKETVNALPKARGKKSVPENESPKAAARVGTLSDYR